MAPRTTAGAIFSTHLQKNQAPAPTRRPTPVLMVRLMLLQPSKEHYSHSMVAGGFEEIS